MKRKLTGRQKASVACNVFIAVFTVVAWTMMITGWGAVSSSEALLNVRGLANLKFFTVLSNLLSGVASAAWAVCLVRATQAGMPVGRAVSMLKLAGTVSVALTFLTVVVLFRLIWGLGGMFLGANFWFHLVLPVAAMLGTCFLDLDGDLRLRDAFAATVPMLLYGVAYYANILINGRGEPPNSNDWYGLASWGMQWAPLVFAIMFAGTLLISLALYAVNRSITRRQAI